jgi:hypothetical protein
MLCSQILKSRDIVFCLSYYFSGNYCPHKVMLERGLEFFLSSSKCDLGFKIIIEFEMIII